MSTTVSLCPSRRLQIASFVQSKTQRYSIYYHRRRRKPANFHIWNQDPVNFVHFCLKHYFLGKINQLSEYLPLHFL